ncbi:MAG TPA: hypothetical protein VHZ24_20710 [Pirellulales bacterium]|nr:hypothetical protein [Pirellulales bacterium]
MLTCLLASIVGLTPAEAVAAALVDVPSLPAGTQGQTRYLVLTSSTHDERRQQAQAVSFLLNSVSRSRVIVQPIVVGAESALLRFDLAAYADFRQPETYTQLFTAWERLAKDDPYFHIRTQVAAGSKIDEVTTDVGWIDLAAAKKLRELTGSFGAVLRADYFVATVGGAAYYEWAGIPEHEADFYKLFGVDTATVNRLAADSAANLFRSHVTNKPRRIIERPGVFGTVLQTKDVDRESPDRDPLRNPIDFQTQRFDFQASELFALGANKLWRVALYDAQGNRQATVPDRVAKDFAGDGIIAPLVSCLRCHERNGGRAGLQPFHDSQTELINAVGLSTYVPEVAQRIGQLYDPMRMDKAMTRAREDYAEAVAMATGGLSPAETTDLLVEMYASYLDHPVTPEQAAYELGIEHKQLAEALAGSRDAITLAVGAGMIVNRAAWASAFGDAALRAEQFRLRGKP